MRIKQIRATLLGARRVPERLCGGYVYLGRYIKSSTFTFTFKTILSSIRLLSLMRLTLLVGSTGMLPAEKKFFINTQTSRLI